MLLGSECACARRIWPRLALAFGLFVLSAAIGLAIGPANVPLGDTIRILLSHLPGVGTVGDVSPAADAIIWDVRLPRVLLAGAVGAALAMSGATYQGVFRNPLADPYLIGVATGAALGATIVVVSGGERFVAAASACCRSPRSSGALIAVVVVYGVARVGQHRADDDADPRGRGGVVALDGDHLVPDAQGHDEHPARSSRSCSAGSTRRPGRSCCGCCPTRSRPSSSSWRTGASSTC